VGVDGLLGEVDCRLLGGQATKPTFIHFTPSGQLPPQTTTLNAVLALTVSGR
jgi:hypothetical protein